MLMLNKTAAAATSSVIALLPGSANRALVRFRMTSSNRENVSFVATLDEATSRDRVFGRDSRRTLNPALALVVPARIFGSMISRILAPFLEVGFAAFRQIVSPCRLERGTGIIERRSGAVSLFTGIAAGLKSAMPFRLIRRRRCAGSLLDQTDADTGIVDMPMLRLFISLLADVRCPAVGLHP
jgi:hypothetical protein